MDSPDRAPDVEAARPAGTNAPAVVEKAAPLAAPVAEGACPFLVAAAGAWRMSIPDRDHRCAAFSPATSLAPSKQARLCLAPAHAGCATYLASTMAREARIGSGAKLDRAGRWGIARTMPVVQEVGGLRATLGALVADRRTWPAVPAVLLATLALALGLSGTWGEGPATAVASPTAIPETTVTPAPTAHASSAASEAPSAAPSPAPSTTPTTAPSPTPNVAYTIYRVKSGDTLSRIASKFGTTSRAIAKLNGIAVTSTLHPGQVLKIPKT